MQREDSGKKQLKYPGYPVVEKLIDKAEGSIYKLVMLASKRVKELNSGAAKLVEAGLAVKLPLVALEEIRQGKIKLKNK